jgi:hypothetical protein
MRLGNNAHIFSYVDSFDESCKGSFLRTLNQNPLMPYRAHLSVIDAIRMLAKARPGR